MVVAFPLYKWNFKGLWWQRRMRPDLHYTEYKWEQLALLYIKAKHYSKKLLEWYFILQFHIHLYLKASSPLCVLFFAFIKAVSRTTKKYLFHLPFNVHRAVYASWSTTHLRSFFPFFSYCYDDISLKCSFLGLF